MALRAAQDVVREFRDDQCTDLAAALTYYAVLAIFPAALALTALLGLVGQAREVRPNRRRCARAARVPSRRWAPSRPVLEDLAELRGRRLGLVVGLVLALWSASAYIGAFGRAMNRIYEIGEGRPFWKLRPISC